MEETCKCEWCGDEYETSELKKDRNLGYLCWSCIRAIESRGEKLNLEEEEL